MKYRFYLETRNKFVFCLIIEAPDEDTAYLKAKKAANGCAIIDLER